MVEREKLENDLISRSALINTLFVRNGEMCSDNDIDNFSITINVKDVKEAIRNAPTAYDVDKVVERLRKAECNHADYRYNYAIDTETAINIVESGGIEGKRDKS